MKWVFLFDFYLIVDEVKIMVFCFRVNKERVLFRNVDVVLERLIKVSKG